jgi:hypothetical protein
VLNVNELAQGLRAMHLPGEKRDIKITQVGQDRSQGVGYLEDGTMVVVEQAAKKLNQHVQVEFTRMLQTQAGKMMFATLAGGYKYDSHEKPPYDKKPAPKPPALQPQKVEPQIQPAEAPKPQTAFHSDQAQQAQAQGQQRQHSGNNNRRRRQPRTPHPASAGGDDGHVKL